MTLPSLSSVWPALESAAQKEGAIAIGASDLAERNVEVFERWLHSGHAASMNWLLRHLEVRRDPSARFPWARSVVAILVPYASDRPLAPAGALSHHIARYALGDDYHEILDSVLEKLEQVILAIHPEAKSWRYTDTGPLSDRSLAAQAGLGWIGRNGMLIDPEHGSWFFIGTLLTSLENDIESLEVADRCGTCTRCVDACPTAAILPDRTIDSNRCISHATIEERGMIPDDIAGLLSGNAFGCDICQEVCPWNSAPPAEHPAFTAREVYGATPVTDLLRFSRSDFSTFFRRSAIKRAKHAGMQRNVRLAGGGTEQARSYSLDE